MAQQEQTSGSFQKKEQTSGDAASDNGGAHCRPISTVVIIIGTPSSFPVQDNKIRLEYDVFAIAAAMQMEARPLLDKFQLSKDTSSLFPPGVPWLRYHGTYKDLNLNIILPGTDPLLGVANIGTLSASLVTYASIQALKPDLLINAGTAGGFKAKGACVGDVYVVSEVAFHDRRMGPPFDLYGIGARKSYSTPNLINRLNLKVGKLSTGDSLDLSPSDEASISANESALKDMEGAAVAYTASIMSVPSIFVKAVTDIVNGDNLEELTQNFTEVATILGQKLYQVIDFLNGKSLSQL